MTVVEAECDAPIPGDRYSPRTSEVSLERMQPEARKVHIIWPTAAVQDRKNVTKFFNMRRGHPSCRSPIIKGFQPAMFKRPDHFKYLSVVCHLSSDSTRQAFEIHELGLEMAERYGFSIYDGLIVAAAVRAGSAILYTEDLQQGQVIDQVTIQNPFAQLLSRSR